MSSSAYILGVVVQSVLPVTAMLRSLMLRAYIFDVYPWPSSPTSVHKLRQWVTDELRAGISTVEAGHGRRLEVLLATPGLLEHGPFDCLVAEDVPTFVDKARAEEYSPADPAMAQLLADMIRNLRGEESLTRRRLMGAESQWFAEIDRLRSESEFRMTIALPLVGLGAVCGLAEDNWTLGSTIIVGATLMAAVLLGQGYGLAREAGDALSEAIVVGRVIPPCIDRFRRETRWLADE
ncbi:MAG: hypothetical protein JWQ18_2739, partial [Conexibacter sp.]|nr:hypothetical protein [Conexibacter sp.]